MLKNIENNASKAKQQKLNKTVHSLNGNNNTRTKPRKHIKVIQFNKSNSAFETKKELIKMNIEEHKADVAVISEANIKREEKNLNTDFPNHNVESSFMSNLNIGRLAVMIRKGISYKRLKNLEDGDTSTIWIRLKLSKARHLYILGIYRQ